MTTPRGGPVQAMNQVSASEKNEPFTALVRIRMWSAVISFGSVGSSDRTSMTSKPGTEIRRLTNYEGGVQAFRRQVLGMFPRVFAVGLVGFLAMYGKKAARQSFVLNGSKTSFRAERRVWCEVSSASAVTGWADAQASDRAPTGFWPRILSKGVPPSALMPGATCNSRRSPTSRSTRPKKFDQPSHRFGCHAMGFLMTKSRSVPDLSGAERPQTLILTLRVGAYDEGATAGARHSWISWRRVTSSSQTTTIEI